MSEIEGITREEALAHGNESDKCPKCGALGEYEASEFGDASVYQDAQCPNGHYWREISSVTHIVALDEDRNEVGDLQPVSGVRVNPLTHDTYNALRDIRGDISLALNDGTPVSVETLDAIDGVMDVVHDALPEHSHDEDGYD